MLDSEGVEESCDAQRNSVTQKCILRYERDKNLGKFYPHIMGSALIKCWCVLKIKIHT